MDVACGTGANFKHIRKVNDEVRIVGTDYSSGMLRRANDNVKKNKWDNIQLFQADARNLSPDLIKDELDEDVKFDRIICVLGLSVIPNWELALDNMINLLKDDGRIVIVDVFAEKRDFNTWLVEKIAKADLNREIWQVLKERSTDFTLDYLSVKESKVGGKLFVASGIKSR
jgi:ubiquinone/menaquinone biosynthesis C-methylase UbiE